MSAVDGEHDREAAEIAEEDLDLLAYLDGELEGDRLAAFGARLETDRALAARLRALEAVGDFLRGDADRIYRDAKVDGIVDGVFAKLRAEAPAEVAPAGETQAPAGGRHLRVVEGPRSEVAPPTSRVARSRRGTVVWVAFGSIAAAAAAALFIMSGHDKVGPAPVASAPHGAETVAVAKPPPPREEPKVAAPVAESAPTVEVEGLEVGQGAVVFSRGDDDKSPPVVWIESREGAK